MVNKPFWHISDFVLASYTFGCVKISDFVPNNRHLREVLIFFFYSKKTAAEAHRELQKFYRDAALSETRCRDWFRRFKDGDFDVDERPREGRPRTFEDADVIYYELLKPNETITGEQYRTQLMRLSRALREKRPQYEQRYGKMIRAIPERWAKFVTNDKQYFEWFVCNHFFTIKLHFHKKNRGNLIAHLIFYWVRVV